MLGVSRNCGLYKAQINIDRKRVCIGRFRTIEEAQAAYIAAKAKYHAGYVDLTADRKPVLKQYAMDWRLAHTPALSHTPTPEAAA